MANRDGGRPRSARRAITTKQDLEVVVASLHGGSWIVGRDGPQNLSQTRLQSMGSRRRGRLDQQRSTREIPGLHETPGKVVVDHQFRRGETAGLHFLPASMKFGVIPPERRDSEGHVAGCFDE